jgi:hypothetical protein
MHCLSSVRVISWSRNIRQTLRLRKATGLVTNNETMSAWHHKALAAPSCVNFLIGPTCYDPERTERIFRSVVVRGINALTMLSGAAKDGGLHNLVGRLIELSTKIELHSTSLCVSSTIVSRDHMFCGNRRISAGKHSGLASSYRRD